MKHPDGTPCNLPPQPKSPYLREEEEERQPQESLPEERHGNPADNRPRTEPASTALKGGEGGPPKPCGRQREGKKPRRDALDWLTFGVLVLTFFAVGAYAYFAAIQAAANKEAADAATAAAEASRQANAAAYRAWILIMSTEDAMEIRFAAEGWVPGWVRVKNWGGGPAKDVRGQVRMVPSTNAANDPPSPPLFTDPTEDSHAVIGPGAEFMVRMKVKGIGADTMTAVATMNERLFLYGVIRYADAFSGDRATTFCYSYEHDPTATAAKKATDPTAVTEGQWTVCPRWNDFH